MPISQTTTWRTPTPSDSEGTGMRATTKILLLLGLTVAFVPTHPASAATTDVAVKNFSFSPEQVTVPVGGTVKWTNGDTTSHTITANDGSFDSGSTAAGGTFERTFTAAGTFTYFCAIHTSMQGTVQVGGATATTAPTTTTSAPASTTTARVLTAYEDDDGTPGWVAPGIGALLLAAVGGGWWALRRRRSTGVG